MKQIVLLLVALIACHLSILAQANHFSKEEMIADLKLLKNELEETHATLYAYSTPSEIDHWFEDQIKNIPASLNEREAFKIVASISGIIRDGHSYIYPSAQHLDDFFNKAPLFPFDVFLKGNKLIVVEDFSEELQIPPGATLVEINGVKIEEIQAEIVGHTCRDGDNEQYPEHLFYQFFPAYYSYLYGFPKEFEISYLDKGGSIRAAHIMGKTRSEIRTKRNAEAEQGIELEVLPNQESAVLTIKSFDKNILKQDYGQKFKKEIKRAFKLIEEQQIQHLAIDLRDNQGGELSHGIYLMQHFMKTPFQSVNNYTKLKNGETITLNTKWDDHFKPKSKYHFDKAVYLFINGGSFSCSAIVANTFKETKRGIVLGQMTGGSAYVNGGAPNKLLTLPNTKIIFTIPRTRYNLRNQATALGMGVLPDVELESDPDRLIGETDNYIRQFTALTKK